MTTDRIFNLIETIAATPGKNDKVALLRAHQHDMDLPEILFLAYNPFYTYGVRSLPEATPQGSGGFTASTRGMLMDLVNRSLTGSAARDRIGHELSKLSPASAELLRRVLLKDMRAGINESTINSVMKGLIPEFAYMRCSLPKHVKLDKFDWARGVYSQVKADGLFVNINYERDGTVQFVSRQGHPFRMEGYPKLVALVRRHLKPGTQTHGEMVILKDGQVLPRKDGNGVINSVNAGESFAMDEEPVLQLWDQIPLSEVKPGGKYQIHYDVRMTELKEQVGLGYHNLHIIQTRIVYSWAEAQAHRAEVVAAGGEGTVIKDANGPWMDGTSKWQVKLKLEVTVDLKITGFTGGKGKFAKWFGALVTETEDGLLSTDVSGMSDAMRKKISENRQEYLGAVVSVMANDLSEIPGQKAALMHPRLDEIRRDKRVADTLDQVRDQFSSAKGL